MEDSTELQSAALCTLQAVLRSGRVSRKAIDGAHGATNGDADTRLCLRVRLSLVC